MHTLATALIRAGVVRNEFEQDLNPEHHQEVGPCRKRAFPDIPSARILLLQLLASPDCISPETLHVYQCWNCRQYHVGHELREKITIPNQ